MWRRPESLHLTSAPESLVVNNLNLGKWKQLKLDQINEYVFWWKLWLNFTSDESYNYDDINSHLYICNYILLFRPLAGIWYSCAQIFGKWLPWCQNYIPQGDRSLTLHTDGWVTRLTVCIPFYRETSCPIVIRHDDVDATGESRPPPTILYKKTVINEVNTSYL